MNNSNNIRHTLLVCFILVVSTLVVYWQLGSHEFISYDDLDYVSNNTHIRDGVTLPALKWAFTTSYAANWHPLTWISHMLDIQMYGFNPEGHHSTSLILHIINSMLLFMVLKRMTKVLWQSAFVAAIFALHPLHVESVAWVAERKDVLSTFFWILTMGAYVRYVEKPQIKSYLLALTLFALGLMAKQMLVTLPFVLLLLDYWPLKRFSLSEAHNDIQAKKRNLVMKGNQYSSILFIVREKIPFICLSAISSVVIYFVQQHGQAMFSIDTLPIGPRISNALVSYIRYIVKMIWPLDLAIFYPHPGRTLSLWQVGGACFLLSCITVLVIWVGKRYRYLRVGWLWYIGTLVPVIGIVQVGSQAMADRYSYVSLIGLLMIMTWGIPDLLSQWHFKRRQIVLITSGTIIIAACMITASRQVGYWKDNVSLFSHAIEVTDNNFFAHNDLGDALEKQGHVTEAVAHYRQAIQMKPNFAFPHSNLGAALGKQGNFSEAIIQLSEALRLKPDHADAHNNLGIVLAMQGKTTDALAHFSEAVRIDPDHWNAHYNLGLILAGEEKYKEAIEEYYQTLRIKPDHREARTELERLVKIQK